MSTSPEPISRTRSLLRHLGRNSVAYLALFIALAMSPLPSWAAKQIGTAQIKNGAVTAKKLKNDAVTSKKIKNGQVTKADLAPAAQGYTKFVTVRETVADVDINESVVRSVSCPAGAVAISGGASVSPSGVIFLGGSAGQVIHSIPVTPFTILSPTGTAPAGNAVAPTGWRTGVTNDTGADDRTASFWAICASK